MSETKITATAISIDGDSIKQLVDQAVEKNILNAIDGLLEDPAWVEKIERLAIQAMVQRVVAKLSSVDVSSLVQDRVDELFQKRLLKNFATTGIEDHATRCQFTVMDASTVVENQLTARDLEVVGSTVVKDLVVKGTINTDNRSWDSLANRVSEQTLAQLGQQWRDQLVEQVAQTISHQGINFEQVRVGHEFLISGNRLSSAITESNIEKLGNLQSLTVLGNVELANTVTVTKKRLGINTQDPESALTLWDEEVNLIAGKHKSQEAYLGTARKQSLHIGVNREPMLTVDTEGTTTVKKLRIGQHRLSHGSEVPNWSGTRGDIVFNANPTPGSAFAWICLGAFKWKSVRVLEE